MNSWSWSVSSEVFMSPRWSFVSFSHERRDERRRLVWIVRAPLPAADWCLPPAHGSVTLQTDWCWHVWLAACNNMWQACWGADNSVLCFGASISGEICAHLSYNESRFNLLKTEWTGLLITSRLFFSHWLALHERYVTQSKELKKNKKGLKTGTQILHFHIRET